MGSNWLKTNQFRFTITLSWIRKKNRKLRFLAVFLAALAHFECFAHSTGGASNLFSVYGPGFSRFETVQTGAEKTEALGPFLTWERKGTQKLFAMPPLFSLYRDEGVPQTEFEFAYPFLSFDRFGTEYRLHLFQIWSFSGGESIRSGEQKKRFTLFPFYFQQRSPDPEDNYTALVPFYGHIKNRLFRDDIKFIMLPLYLQTTKRHVVTDNYLFPIFHLREGKGLKGWQVWPLVGKEHKEVTTTTNVWGDVSVVAGHDKFFALWPFFFNNTLGIGTTNVQKQFVLLPFYSSQVASNRVSRSYGLPFGYTHTIDRERKYEERDAPWPFVVFASGEGKNTRRIWPFFSEARTPILQSDFYMWPIYKYNRATADPLDRERTRILLFLYSDMKERNTTNNTMLHRIDFWPFFTWRKERDNSTRLQALSILEPLLPNNKSIERVYSPIYAFWRQERNAKTGESSKSLLWNLYRYENRREGKRHSALFGGFQRKQVGDRTDWRVFWIPFTTAAHKTEETAQQ